MDDTVPNGFGERFQKYDDLVTSHWPRGIFSKKESCMKRKTLSAYWKTVIPVLLLSTIGFSMGSVCFSMENKASSFKHPMMQPKQYTDTVQCENCGMNLKKFISTNHVVKMKNGDTHFYCSINCSTDKMNELGNEADSVFAINYNSTKFIYVGNAYYVIGSSLRGTMTNVSKFSFENLDDAEEFSKNYNGKEIVNYQTAFDMSAEEIKNRKK